MENKSKFIVQLEIEVQYNVPEEAVGETPYTVLETTINNDTNVISIKTEQGKIIGFNNLKFERK